MGMNVGNRGQKAEINMTPMIDVLLVLIIIFMVITPTQSRGLTAMAPQQADAPPETKARPQIVLSVAQDGAIEINSQPVDLSALSGRLASLRGLADALFIRGDRGLNYEAVARVIDIAHGAGWERIGLMTR
jgi:biopolymer transport protein TolR